MQSNLHYQQSIFKILIIIIVFGLSSLPNSIIEAAANNMIPLQLLDLNANPLSHVRLTAWRINTSHSQDSGHTGASGTALLHLPPGQYYVTGDITTLKNQTAYAAGLKNNHTTTLYFISTIFTVSENTKMSTLTIDNTNYIDIADISGVKGFQIHLSQRNLGIETNVSIAGNHNWLRLYLPTRMQYTIQQVEGILHLQWPIYAAPGLQFILSSGLK
ncbi:hypothetical protein [Pelosinus fermentans]|uniref:Uncharacterized protein n=1 Tax=Pelosinus fermentans JBW45 TaxID=1192197 RepID=I9NN74_9FIRM|nr:hypothetical protein [Pelosinus fermentans]AJQ25910.1 hypothetical protein JBW_00558 [Pelosinus fermentans JBW45]